MNRDECIFLMNNIYKGSIDLMILLYERALKRALVEKNLFWIGGSKMEHHIKCNKITFEETLKGSKPFEIRKNDRHYQKFDDVIMSEFDADKNKYTGRKLSFEIGFVTNYAQRDGYKEGEENLPF